MEDERMQRRSHVAPEAAEEELRLLVAGGSRDGWSSSHHLATY